MAEVIVFGGAPLLIAAVAALVAWLRARHERAQGRSVARYLAAHQRSRR